MKKTLLTLAAFFAVLVVFSQVQRNQVIMEIGTGTGCQYCPGAAMGAHDLLQNGCQVGVIEYHSYNSSDPFNTPEAAARTGYYGITGYPTAFFDGTLNYVGGSTNTSCYPQYLPLYNQRYAVPSPLTVDITGTNSGNNYSITLTITKVSSITASDLRAHLVLTESGIPYSWQGQSEINNTERLMVPDQNGTVISFASGNTVVLNLSFTKNASWVTNNCELIAFVQNNTTKECLNGSKKMLNQLMLPLVTNFTATPVSGCTPLTVQFTDQSVGATSWSWTFPGGTPATSTVQNPVVVYNTAGSFDVTLQAFNIPLNQGGTAAKTAYINTTSTPTGPAAPAGTDALCVNPSDQTYTITATPNTTSYTWELTPAAAGVITPNGTSCTVNWDNAWTGVAQLRARSVNSCGNSPWSPFLNITISQLPGTPGTPAGPTTACMNGTSDYTTTGTTNAASYFWELLPAAAGGVYTNGMSATVSWAATFTGTATLKVKGLNGACDGPWSAPVTVTVNPGPAAYNVTGGGAYCGTGGTGVPVGLDNSQAGTSYTLYLDNNATTNVVTGTGAAISFGSQTAAGAYTVKASTGGSCTNTMTGNAVVTVDPAVPGVPGVPMGPNQVYSGTTPTTDYTTTPGNYASTYFWEVEPAAAGTMSGNTMTGTAIWSPTYTGTATVKVQAVNTCGSSSFTTGFTVAVAAWHVGIGEKSQGLCTLYPNPAHSLITIIPVRAMNADIRVFNALGTEVMAQSGVSLKGNYKMDVSSLRSGLYFVRISSDGEQQTIKLVVD